MLDIDISVDGKLQFFENPIKYNHRDTLPSAYKKTWLTRFCCDMIHFNVNNIPQLI